ncbi:MAG: SDR family oxidoreductase [Myxococcota bacterium]
MGSLRDRRVLVVGGSSGIGRATALHLAQQGARVVAAARRADALEALAAEHPGLTASVVDATDPEAVAGAVARAVTELGGLDALVYTAGLLVLGDAPDLEPRQWRRSLDVNLMGAVWSLGAASPALRAGRGRALLVSSRAPVDHPPRRGMAPYIVSKAALDALASVWEVECPEIAITRVTVGDTGPTEMGRNETPETLGRYVGEWAARKLLVGRILSAEQVARHLGRLLEEEEAVPVSSILPRPAVES